LFVLEQVIAWKDSSPKWPVMCRVGRKTLLTHSLTHSSTLSLRVRHYHT